MGYAIEISSSKIDKLSDYAEKMLHYGGMLMRCIEGLEDGEFGQRGGSYGSRSMMGSRGGEYGSRGYMGYRDDEDWDEEEMMGERRGRRRRRDSMGRYR